MRGSIWSLVALGTVGALLLPLATDGVAADSGGTTSQQIAALFDPFGELVGVIFLVVAVATLLSFFLGGESL